MSVRAARPDDTGVIAGLLTDLGYETGVDGLAVRLAEFVAAADDVVLVDDRGGTVVGVIVASRTPSLIDPSPLGRITALSVAASHHRRGVGATLVAAAEAWLAERGVPVVQVNCGRRPARMAAHEFYPALGYRDQHDHHVLYEKQLS